MADRELRIKMTLDKAGFDAAAKDANKTLQDTGKHLKDGTDAATAMRNAMLQMVGVQTGMAAVGQVIGAIGSSMKEAADYTKRVAEAFGVTRDAMREIAAIQGKGLTGDFVQSQLDVAKKAQILTPQEMTSGSLAFQQFGSAYIGEQGVDPATGKDNGSRISQSQLDELLPSVFAAAKVQGVEQGAAGQIFAKIVQNMPAHSKTSEYKDTFAKILEMSKNSSGSASMTANQLGPFLSANAGEGGAYAPTMEGLLSATKHVAAVSEVKPEEAGAYTNQMVQDLNRIELKGKDNDFGITDDMDTDQKVKAIADTWKRETGGKNFKKWYSQKLGGRGGNIQATNALAAIVMKGIGGGFFDAMEQKASKVSGDTLDKALAQHMIDKPDDAAKAGLAISEAERGKEYAGVELELTRARGELTGEGAFESAFHPLAYIGSKLPGGAKDSHEQLVNERALSNAQAKAAAAGVDMYAGPDALTTATPNTFVNEQSMRSEIKRLVELTEQANAQRGTRMPHVINGKPNVGFPR